MSMNNNAKIMFTIMVVTYNSGDKLQETLDSIDIQRNCDMRVIIKDGMSTDGSIEGVASKYFTDSQLGQPGLNDQLDKGLSSTEQVETVRISLDGKYTLLQGRDKGIYDAMNIATRYAGDHSPSAGHEQLDLPAGAVNGSSQVLTNSDEEIIEFVYFLNCGDSFADDYVLSRAADKFREAAGDGKYIIYGDVYDMLTGNRVASNPVINDFTCYRNVPSHQACFYDMRLMKAQPFDLRYKVRADYEQFIRCRSRESAQFLYLDMLITNYEGGGFSESKENLKRSELERKEIINMYLPRAQVLKFDAIRYLTLAPLRTAISHNKLTAGMYNRLKSMIYRHR